MLKVKRFLMVILSALFIFVFGACGDDDSGSKATLNAWNAPTYQSVTVGSGVYVQNVYATDSEGNIHTATSQVLAPNGSAVTVNNNLFVANTEGTYTIVYTISFNGQDMSKSSSVLVTAASVNPNPNPGGNGGNSGNGGNGGNSGNSGNASAILGALQVMPGSENYFSVSGNVVTVRNTCSAEDWKTVGWTLNGWTLANGETISIRVTNNTTGTVSVKYKAKTGAGDQYGYPDLSIAPGASDTYTKPTGTDNDATPSSVSSIELALGSTVASGTITIEANIYGAGGPTDTDMGTTTVGAMALAYEDASHTDLFSVSGKVLTIKQAVSVDSYKGVKFTVSNWDRAKAANVSVTVKNNTSGNVTVKYKVTTNSTANNGVGWGYPDLTVAAGATGSYSGITKTNDCSDATDVTLIELIIGADATGTIEIDLKLF